MPQIIFGTHVVAPDANSVSLEISHAFLLLSNDSVASDDDLVFRVGPSNGIGGSFKIEQSTSYSVSEDNPTVWGSEYDIENPLQYYAFAALDIGARNALDGWNRFSGVVNQISSYEIGYDLFVTNYNTFIRNLLEVADIYVTPPDYSNGESSIFPGGLTTLVYDSINQADLNYVSSGSDQDNYCMR